MNEKFQNTSRTYLPKLQEKARQCKTKDELLQLAADEDMEIPMDALEGVAGGCGDEQLSCPYCGSTDISSEPVNGHGTRLFCRKCEMTIKSAFQYKIHEQQTPPFH